MNLPPYLLRGLLHHTAHGMRIFKSQSLPYSISKKSLQVPASRQNDRSEHLQGARALPALLPANAPCSLQNPWKTGGRHV